MNRSQRHLQLETTEPKAWWCRHCGAFVASDDSREMLVCARCGRPGLKPREVETAVMRERAAEWFTRMREAVDAA